MNHSMNSRSDGGVGSRSWPKGAGALILSILLLAGCDSLLEVKAPGVISSSAWDDPANADLLVVAALGEFECMVPSFIRATGVISHELISSGILGVEQNWGARRDILRNDAGACGNTIGIFRPLQDARFMAETGYEKISGFGDGEVPGRARMLAELAAYAGYAYVYLGEAMCSAPVDGGPLLSRAELFARAEDRFGAAMTHAQASGHEAILQMARVGRARARLDAGDLAGARADAELVPEGFVRHAERSTVVPRRYNSLTVTTHEERIWSVHPSYHDLEVDGVADTRVRIRDHQGPGQDNETPQFSPLKYDARSTPIPIARWEEAQLILAEVAGGQEAVGIINRLRERAGLPSFESTDPQEIRQAVIEERRRELFLEGHRLHDMIRFGIPFPTGLTHKGQPYGDATCVGIPDAERNANPNIS